MSRQIDLQSVLSDDELEYLESRGRDADLAVNGAFLINETEGETGADPNGDAGEPKGDEGKTGAPPEPVANDDQKPSEPAKAQTSTDTRQPPKKS